MGNPLDLDHNLDNIQERFRNIPNSYFVATAIAFFLGAGVASFTAITNEGYVAVLAGLGVFFISMFAITITVAIYNTARRDKWE